MSVGFQLTDPSINIWNIVIVLMLVFGINKEIISLPTGIVVCFRFYFICINCIILYICEIG